MKSIKKEKCILLFFITRQYRDARSTECEDSFIPLLSIYFVAATIFSVGISAGFLLIISKGLFVRGSADSGVCVFSKEQENARVSTGCACCWHHWQAAYYFSQSLSHDNFVLWPGSTQ